MLAPKHNYSQGKYEWNTQKLHKKVTMYLLHVISARIIQIGVCLVTLEKLFPRIIWIAYRKPCISQDPAPPLTLGPSWLEQQAN